MNEPMPEYQVNGKQTVPEPLPRRAANLARRVLQLERECNGRGRLTLEIVMVDGEWLLVVARPGELERLGE